MKPQKPQAQVRAEGEEIKCFNCAAEPSPIERVGGWLESMGRGLSRSSITVFGKKWQ